MLSLLLQAPAFSPSACPGRMLAQAPRAPLVSMDETILEKALAGELEQEGAENIFLTEVGWATYLDQSCGSSYAMNERPSMAQDGYFTADIFSNPLEVLSDFKDGIIRALGNPLETGFPTISNDQSGARSYPKGATEITARTIKPKTKDFEPSQRITNIPGYNLFGAPSSKLSDVPFVDPIFND
ncbi:hypothetical protein AB1Y20_000749 [Prymnesium parvum]|uniref:Uncharacterized protein n=1 Tax=Prymnesium parvum TaxID=97485 RepID=A0AB34K9F6_PRYPA|mmetsp:Transcript_9092/g.22599  ORF Transcript_9092/g.22599 Transcript_9092/m.22599 type:complete len:184 (+) Transcript_9092:22-573(+)